MEPDPVQRSGPGAILAATACLVGVALAWSFLHAWGLEKTPFHTKGEPREAVMVLDIVQNGRWILPRRAGVELPAKPPLFHWLGAIASRLGGGPTERTIRLPSAILSGAAALLLFVCTTILYGPLAALLAALALLTSFEWTRAATSARVDMTLAFGMTLSFLGFTMRRAGGRAVWLIVAYAGMAWGALAKGPVGAALPVLHVLVMCAVDRSVAFAREVRLVRGLVAVVLVVGAWYGLALAEGGREFFAKQILDENVYRFLGSEKLTGGHRHSVGYLGGMLLLGLLPWTLFLPSVAADLWRDRSRLGRRDPRLFALLWTLLVFAFYAQAASKRGVYLLPTYPALCLLLGSWASPYVVDVEEPRSRRRLAASFQPLAWLLAALLGALTVTLCLDALGLPVLQGSIAFLPERAARDAGPALSALSAHPAPLALSLGIASFSACIAAFGAAAGRRVVVFCGLAGASAAATIGIRQVVLPAIAEADTRRHFVSAVRRLPIDRDDLQAVRHIDYGFVFYWNRALPVYDGSLSPTAPSPLLLSESEWARLQTQPRQPYERIANLESGRAGNLGHLVVVHRIAPESGDDAPEGGNR